MNSPDHAANQASMASLAPGDLIRIVLRRLPSIVLVTTVLFAVVLAILYVWPNAYRSDGLLYVRLGRGAVSVDPTSQASEAVSIQDPRSSEVISVSEMLSSREVADRVVAEVGADRINQPRNWIERFIDQVDETVSGIGLGSVQDDAEVDRQKLIAQEEAAAKVRKSVGFTVPKNGYTVAISATTPDPFLARDIVQSYLDQYGAFHVEAHQTSGSFDFFDEQTEQSRRAVADAQQALHQRRSELGWMSPERAEEAIQLRMIELEVALDKANSDLADAVDLTESLQQQIETIEPWIPIQTSRVANLAADEMKAALYEARIAESEMMAKFKPDHPRYKRLQQKFSEGETMIAGEDDTEEETTEAINPIYQQLRGELELAKAKAKGLQARRDSLGDSLEEVEDKLQRLNHDSIELADLAMAADVAEKNFVEQSESLERARTLQELDRQQLSDISVIQDASLNLKKAGPRRAALAVIGLLGCLCLGLAQSLVRPLPASMQRRERSLAVEPSPIVLPGRSSFDSTATHVAAGTGGTAAAGATTAQSSEMDGELVTAGVGSQMGSTRDAGSEAGMTAAGSAGPRMPR